MHFTKKIDRAFQWAGEKIGGEKTGYSDEFKSLEAEMTTRHDGNSFLFRPGLVLIRVVLIIYCQYQAWKSCTNQPMAT